MLSRSLKHRLLSIIYRFVRTTVDNIPYRFVLIKMKYDCRFNVQKAIAAFDDRNSNNENESFAYRIIQNRVSRLNGSDGEVKASDLWTNDRKKETQDQKETQDKRTLINSIHTANKQMKREQ